MPCRSLEMPIGQHVWKTRREDVLKALREVLFRRREQLEIARREQAVDERYLPFKYQKVVQDQLYKDWLASDDIDNFNVRTTITRLGLGASDSQRMYKSYYRRYLARVFGSAEWMHAVIALGHLPADFVELIRENCMRRKALASAQGNTEPRQLKREDRPSQAVQGLHHKVSHAKELREKAKLIDQRISHENARWGGELAVVDVGAAVARSLGAAQASMGRGRGRE